MKALIVSLSLMAVGCGGPFHPKTACAMEGTGEWLLEDADVGCAYYQDILDQAISETVAHGFAPEQEFRKAIAGSTVWVHSSTWSFGCYLAQVEGCVSPDASEVQVDKPAGSIMHELLHRWDMAGLHRDSITTAEHAGWAEKGWLQVSAAFIYSHNLPTTHSSAPAP